MLGLIAAIDTGLATRDWQIALIVEIAIGELNAEAGYIRILPSLAIATSSRALQRSASP